MSGDTALFLDFLFVSQSRVCCSGDDQAATVTAAAAFTAGGGGTLHSDSSRRSSRVSPTLTFASGKRVSFLWTVVHYIFDRLKKKTRKEQHKSFQAECDTGRNKANALKPQSFSLDWSLGLTLRMAQTAVKTAQTEEEVTTEVEPVVTEAEEKTTDVPVPPAGDAKPATPKEEENTPPPIEQAVKVPSVPCEEVASGAEEKKEAEEETARSKEQVTDDETKTTEEASPVKPPLKDGYKFIVKEGVEYQDFLVSIMDFLKDGGRNQSMLDDAIDEFKTADSSVQETATIKCAILKPVCIIYLSFFLLTFPALLQ